MLGELTYRQLVEWTEFFRLEHLGDSREWRADVRTAVMTRHLASMFAKKGAKVPTIEDFMPSFKDDEPAAETATGTGTADPAANFRARMLAYAKRSKGGTQGDRTRGPNGRQRARETTR